MMIYSIYGLIDPVDGKIKYVGATTKKVSDRSRQHIHEAVNGRKSKNPKNKWIYGLKQKGLEPVPCLLQRCEEGNWKKAERKFIAMFDTLLNIEKGGSSLYTKTQRSKESIERSAEAHKTPVVQLDKFGNFIREWESITGAANHYNTVMTNITNVIGGVTHTAKGFRWVKKSEYKPGIKFKKNKGFTLCKAVHQDTGEELLFESITECGKHFNVTNSWISKSLSMKGELVVDNYRITKY